MSQGNAYANDPPHSRDSFSGTLKRTLIEKIARPESDIIDYHKERGEHGKMLITITFETYASGESM
jgi:hypothetical protein